MRSQSGNYNYSKTFFPPLGHIWAMFLTTLKAIFPPFGYSCFWKGCDVDLFTFAHAARYTEVSEANDQ